MKRLSLVALLVLVACPETNPDSFPQPQSPCADFSTPQGYIDALKCSEYQSCAFACTCSEPAKPVLCPAMQPWSAMSHGTCGTYDGTTLPTVIQGACSANDPTGDAVRKTGLDPLIAGRYHLPDGHYVQPAGHEEIIHGADVTSAFLVDMVLVPATRFAVVVDAGVADNALYAVDLDALSSGAPALVSDVRFAAPQELDYGLAFVAPNEIYASGAGNGMLFAFTIDLQTGALTRDGGKDVDLGPASVTYGKNRWYTGGIAATLDPTKMVVAPTTNESEVRIVDLVAKTWKSVDTSPAQNLFGVFADPNDTTGNTYWATTYDKRTLLRIDMASAKVTASYATHKNPEGVAITPNHVIVASSDDDVLDVYDVSGNEIQKLDLRIGGVTGAQPGVLAYDPVLSRVYATLSGINAIGVYAYDKTSKAPLNPLGQIPTSWWPTAIRLRADGSLVIATAKGHGTGPATGSFTCPDLTRGSVAVVAPPTDQSLAGMSATVAGSRGTSTQAGFPTVTCPTNSLYDFPIPLTNKDSSSPRIDHVVYVVRENKTFDSIFGDLPGVDGDAANVLAPGRMDEIWANMRALARTFSNFDDYGIDAEQSLQGHIWTAYGRSTDYIERAWSSTWGRNARIPKAGLDSSFGAPSEGSLFAWAERNAIAYQDMGEIVGVASQSLDSSYPGILYTQLVPDTTKACYIAARARALCDLKSLTYVVLPNDHTYGSDPGRPTVDIMIAVNDVATGMIADALSHSPLWASTLLIVTEDDPQTGQDHVDAHRTPLVMISPWVKRGYVSHTKIGTASIHKLLAHIFAKPYQSESVQDAAIPYDAFTSTPDYTPYTYSPLQTPVGCNPAQDYIGSPHQPGRNFSLPDQIPELGREVENALRNGSQGALTRPTR